MKSRASTRAASPPAPPPPCSPSVSSAGTKRRRKAAAPLGDVTNLLPDTPAPIKPARVRRRPVPPTPDTPSTASVTPAATPSAPLTDVTNVLPVLDTPAPANPARGGRRPLPPPSDDADASSSASVTPAPPNPSSSASVTPAPTNPFSSAFAALLEEERRVLGSAAISTFYVRRRTTEVREKGASHTTGEGEAPAAAAAAATGTASCPQLGKSARNDNRKTSAAKHTRPTSSSAPCLEAKKKRAYNEEPPSASTPKLPDDFVKKQRAYFADIDAFELPEEEVSETELE